MTVFARVNKGDVRIKCPEYLKYRNMQEGGSCIKKLTFDEQLGTDIKAVFVLIECKPPR